MITLREELEKLARAYVDVRDDDLPIRANALVIVAANLALEAAARECDRHRALPYPELGPNYVRCGRPDECAAAIRAMRVG